MSNKLNQNPYIVDTVMTLSLKNTSGAKPSQGPILISAVTWVYPTNNGDTAIIVDQSGAVICSMTATALTPQTLTFDPALYVSDFRVTTLASSQLLIYSGQAQSVSIEGGTVTNATTALTANAVVVGNGLNDEKVVVGLGTAGQSLTSQGAGLPPSWTNPPGTGTVTHTGTLTSHAVIVGDGGVDVSPLAALGSSGQVLTSAGSSANPAWQTPLSNAAGANVVPKSNGTNLVASSLTDDGSTVSSSIPLSAPSVSTASTNGGFDGLEGTGASLTPASAHDLMWADSTLHRWAMNNNNGSSLSVAGLVKEGTAAMGTSAISAGACATVVTVSATGVATTDVVNAGFNGDPTGVTGYVPLTTGMLTIIAYPTADNVNFKVCNNTSGSITPGAITLNWIVLR